MSNEYIFKITPYYFTLKLNSLNELMSLQFSTTTKTLSKTLSPEIKKIKQQLEEYFLGKRKVFDFKHTTPGVTNFQKDVYRSMFTIKHGEQASYKDLAIKAGYPKAYRAVGSVCNKNPLPIIYPCHRIVASAGIGGFATGLKIKQHLLSIEQN